MPTDVGVVTNFTAFRSDNPSPYCKYLTLQCSVMRFSDQPHDLIYRYDDASTDCYVGFCGMD